MSKYKRLKSINSAAANISKDAIPPKPDTVMAAIESVIAKSPTKNPVAEKKTCDKRGKRKTAAQMMEQLEPTVKSLPARRSILSPGAYREVDNSDDETGGTASSRKRRRRGRRCSDDDRSFTAHGYKASAVSPNSSVASRRLNIKQEPDEKPKIKLSGNINLCSDDEEDSAATDAINATPATMISSTTCGDFKSDILVPQPLLVVPSLIKGGQQVSAARDYSPASSTPTNEQNLEDHIEVVREEAPIDLTGDDGGIGEPKGEDYLNSVIQELFPSDHVLRQPPSSQP